MSGGFTGDSSVRWFVNVDFARPGYTTLASNGPTGLDHAGTEETKKNARFVIKIKYPKNPAARRKFCDQLRQAAGNKKARTATFKIPIEDIKSGFDPPTDNQVVVDWQPKLTEAPPPPPAKPSAVEKYFERPFNHKF
jgi:hypothetical protein